MTVYLIFFSWILVCIFILMYILFYFEPSVLHPLPKLLNYVVASVCRLFTLLCQFLCVKFIHASVLLSLGVVHTSWSIFFFFFTIVASCIMCLLLLPSHGWLSHSVYLCLGFWLFPRPLIVLRVCVYLLSCNMLVIPVLLSCQSLLILYGWNFYFTIVAIVYFGFTMPLIKVLKAGVICCKAFLLIF